MTSIITAATVGTILGALAGIGAVTLILPGWVRHCGAYNGYAHCRR